MKSADLLKIVSKYRIPLDTELSTQRAIENILNINKLSFAREHSLDKANRPDFFMDGLVIEIKIKGSSKEIYRQLERYSRFDSVTEILLITNKAMGLPKEINGRPTTILNLGKGWL